MKNSLVSALTALVLSVAPVLQAADTAVEPMLSFQGTTGIINTPTAQVSSEGNIHLIYSNQRESAWRNDRRNWQDNYLLSVGMFSFFELGGRLTEAPGRARDLSASIKATTAPLTRDMPYWPVLAGGIQDVGGGANKFQRRYIVMSEDLWRFRLSLGYGFGPDMMKGAFGGAEFRVHDWVTLLGEYDTKDTSAGIRVVTPEIWKTPLRLTGTIKSTLNHKPEQIDAAFGLTFPLDFKKTASAAAESETGAEIPASAAVQTVTPPAALSDPDSRSVTAASPAVTGNMTSIQRQLEEAGFINVRVGQRDGRSLVVEYENTIFNHNELDALGMVAGIASETALKKFDMLHLVVVRQGIRMAIISAPLAKLRAFMKGTTTADDLKDTLSFSYDTSFSDYAAFLPDDEGWRFPNTSLIIAPGLMTFAGTEVGVFDYLLSLKPEIISNLWKGGVFQARWDIPVAWSRNFNDGMPFSRNRNDARMDRGMLFQGIRLLPDLMANLGAGLVLHDTYGTLNEMTWNPWEGAHRFRGVQAWARNPYTRRNTEVYLGSYRYFLAPLDLALEATGGRYWGQDKGFSLELKRFFGDTAVSAFYKNTTTEQGKKWQAAGIQFAFPLTPRKDLKIGPVQIRGADEWAYAQETTLAIKGQKTNDTVSQTLAINPQPTPAIYRSYFNRDRLSAGYISQHLDRLREAWLKFRPERIDKAAR